MFKTKKRKQHYIWRKYLRSWSSNEQIYCLMNGKIFKSNLNGVGQKRDFYKTNILSESDINFVKFFAIEGSSKLQVDFYSKILELFTLIKKDKEKTHSKYSKLLVDSNLEQSYLINIEEELQSQFELSGETYLNNLLSNDTAFINTNIGYAEFINYLSMQYFRTKKHQDALFDNIDGAFSKQIIKCWNILRFIFANKMATNIIIRKDDYRLITVENNSNIDFITADQPAVNIFDLGNKSFDQVEKFALYYPISPRKAIFFVEKKYFNGYKQFDFDRQSVKEHNNFMFQQSHEQVYSNKKSLLENYL